MTATHEARVAAVEALGVTHGLDPADVETQIVDVGGDDLLELDSKLAEFVIAAIEVALCKTLPTPADLGKDNIRSLGALLRSLAPLLSAAAAS